MSAIVPRLTVCSLLIFVIQAALPAQENRIVGPIDVSRRVVLSGTVHAQAQSRYDQGPTDSTFGLSFVTLTFRPSANQQASLESLLVQQLDRSSPNYHQWLTPEQFGDRFGLNPPDYASVVSWLESQHLHIAKQARARNWIAFSGTASDVALAFHTAIHRYRVNGEMHTANATDVSIPAALEGIISGIRGLDDFGRLPPALPDYTSTTDLNELAPDDWATIYDVSRLYAAGIDGTGQRVGIVGRSDMDQSYIDSFRTQFGLPPMVIEQHLAGPDPGITNAASEAALDLEWSGAIARGATIVYIFANTFPDAAQAAIDQNLATVLSESLSTCEPQSAAVGDRSMAQQANAQGITWVASSGDSGAAGCDPHGFFNAVGNASTVSDGPAVGIPASFPEVTGVGGTQFNEAGGQYWSATNTADGASAVSYIPEVVWNETGDGGLLASGGGASVVFSKPAWQSGPGVPADNARDVPDVSFSAAGNHDPYEVINVNGARVTGGTSASSPSFAGVLALLNQYLVTQGIQAKPGLGNINPQLYRLARATTDIFHDITQGNNKVPCAAGSSGCVNGLLGFDAGPGYDQATGLGSIDVYNLVTEWNSATMGTTTTLVASPVSIAFDGSVQLTATVTPAVASATPPTGTVTFTTGATLLGSAPLMTQGNVSVASVTFAGPGLPAGNAVVAATYSGDSTLNPSTGSGTVAVAAGPGGSFVSVRITPNPAPAGATVKVALTEEAGVSTTVTGWTINGDDDFSFFAEDFGGTALPAGGNLFSNVITTPTPGTRLYVFSGVDANGRTWSQQYTLNLLASVQPSFLGVGSAADGFIGTLAPSSIAAAYGSNLAPATQNVTMLPLPTTLQGSTVTLVDSTGKSELAPLFFVSGGASDQVNFLVPGDLAAGPASVTVMAPDGSLSQAATNIAPVAPAMFQLNTSALAAAVVFDATTNSTTNVFQIINGLVVPLPIVIPASDSVYLVLFGTGLRAANQANVAVTIGTTAVGVSFSGAQGVDQGLDQVNVALPFSLAGSGDVTVQLTADGIAANPVHVTIQ